MDQVLSNSNKFKVEKLAIILAGGLGSRVSKIHPNTPKPMILCANKPFIHWVILFLKKNHFKNIIISTGYLASKIDEYINQSNYDMNIICVKEESQLGTSGGALNAYYNSGIDSDNIFIFNGDSLFLLNSHNILTSCMNITIWARFISDTSRFGSLDIDDDMALKGFNEKKTGSGYINSGIYYFPREKFVSLGHGKSSFENDIFPKLIRDNENIKAMICDAPFIDIGTPESLKLADKFIYNYFQH